MITEERARNAIGDLRLDAMESLLETLEKEKGMPISSLTLIVWAIQELKLRVVS